MRKVSVFGGSGFVGGEFSKQYKDEVSVMSRDEVYADEDTDILYLISTVHNYHPKDGDPFIDIKTNLLHFMSILDSNINKGVVFNLVSTWFVYGKTPEIPAKETSPCNPTGFYSITSRCREQLLISYCETFGLKFRILRLGGVLGIGDQKVSAKKNALQWMVKELAQGRGVEIYKGGVVRDYIDVRDVAQAIHLVLEKGGLNEIYNISNGHGINIEPLIEVAYRESGYKGTVGVKEVPEFHKTVQIPQFYADNSKLRLLGYAQQHDIKNTIKELVHYYENNES